MLSQADRRAMLQATLECSGAVASDLGVHAVWTHVRRHEFLMHCGDDHHRCHIVMSGSADIMALGPDGQYIQIATIEPGEIFGAYPRPCKVRADVRACNPMELVSFDTMQLAQLASTCAGAGAGLAGIFARQLENMLDRYAARVTLTAIGRVYSCLLKTMDSDGTISPAPVVAVLALRAQTTRETASRALSTLERRGIMRREARSWVITSPRLLEELAV